MKTVTHYLLLAVLLCVGVAARAQESANVGKHPTKTFAQLGTPANGSHYYCTDCRATAPCTGAGTGAVAERVNGAWNCSANTPGGSGDVVGPASSTDNALARFDLTTGKQLQNSAATVDDSGSVNIPTGQFYKINGVATSPRFITRVSTQFDKTTALLANVTGLSVNVTAGHTYTFQANLHTTLDGSGGGQVAVRGTATATSIIYQCEAFDVVDPTNNVGQRLTTLGGAFGFAPAPDTFVRINGTITVNAGGTLTIQFAQSSASGTSSVLVGSIFAVEEVQ